MIYDAFDICIVPFPFTDRATSKRRPAVVISGATFNASTGHLVAAMITSARKSSWPNDVPVSDLAAAALPAPCVVRMKLFTLDSGLVIRKAGRLADADITPLIAALRTVFPAL